MVKGKDELHTSRVVMTILWNRQKQFRWRCKGGYYHRFNVFNVFLLFSSM